MRKQVHLVRHAQSVSNGGGATSGNVALIPLSAQGAQDAEAFAAALAIEPPALLVCTENLRSQQTCQIIQRRYPAAPMEVWIGIQEYHFLSFGDMPTTTAERRPHVEKYFAECNPHLRHPGAESFADLCARCTALEGKLAGHPARSILLVGHGYFMLTYLALREAGFPTVSSDLMRQVHERQLAQPIANLQSFTLEF